MKKGDLVKYKNLIGEITSNLLGCEGAGDYMCPPPAFEVTFNKNNKKQIEPKYLILIDLNDV